MKVKELIAIYYGKVILYKCINKELFTYKNIYKGDKENIPEELLDSDVKLFGARRKNYLI